MLIFFFWFNIEIIMATAIGLIILFFELFLMMRIFCKQNVEPKQAYLNLGCLLMASSGKNKDFETPFSTGVGRYSGLVKPGQPNLKRGIEHISITAWEQTQPFIHRYANR